MNKLIIFTLVNISIAGTIFASVNAKTGVAVKTDNPPIIDGEISEQVWNKAIWYNSFVACPGDAIARQQTSFAVLFDKENIYIAAKCDEIHREKMKLYQKNNIDIWRHDSLEFFLQRVGGGEEYRQFLVSAGGGCYALKFITTVFREKYEIPYDNWQAAAKMTVDGYTVETKIPFTLFDKKIPSNGTEWRFNIQRNATTLDSDRYSSWSPASDFHKATDFGYLIFAFSDPQLLQQRLILKRKFNVIISQIEKMQSKYAKFDPSFATMLNAELETLHWTKFKKQGRNIMKINKTQLEEYGEQLSSFSLHFEKLKQFRSEYLLENFFKE